MYDYLLFSVQVYGKNASAIDLMAMRRGNNR